ncbi:MAG: P-loop NTPase [Gammaproteobacteria bacterium]|nr:P-loop NTPase [Gammaproteobacteria bacterium]MDH5801900.1 P-loop NTPase [Gammaproteobacteria bacterium]
MRKILILNSKGGCGKSTIATNLAAYLAHSGHSTSLLDYDKQGSSMNWLKQRPEHKPQIHGIAANKNRTDVTLSFQMRLPAKADWVVLDAPAGVTGFTLRDYVRRVDGIIIPVLPSPIDIHATAGFIKELLLVGRARATDTKIAVVANRVRQNADVYQPLQLFLNSLKLPFLGTLHSSMDYVRAAECGLGIHELDNPRCPESCDQWIPIAQWLETLSGNTQNQSISSIFPSYAHN